MPVEYKEWNGTTGQFDLAANWVGGVIPDADDIAVFNRGSQDVDPSLGNIAAMGGLDIYPGYSGTIGGTGNVLTSSITKVRHLGRAELWLADSAGTTTDVYIRCVNRDVVVHLGGDTMTNITLLRGNVTIDGTMGTIARLIIRYVTDMANDVRCALTAGGAVTLAIIRGGRTTCPIAIATAHLAAGHLELTKGSSGDVNTLYQCGGFVKHDTKETTDLAIVGPGTLDLGQVAKTVTTLIELPNADVRDIEGLHTITTRHRLDKEPQVV